MPYLDAKVYFDGSHYIAIPHTVRIVEEQINHRDYGDLISIPSPNYSQEKEDSVQEPSASSCIKIKDTICQEFKPTKRKMKIREGKKEICEDVFKFRLRICLFRLRVSVSLPKQQYCIARIREKPVKSIT